MASATISIGYNQSAVVAGVAQTEAAINSVSKSVQSANAAAAASGKAFSRNLGGVSMQASDIAVQLQGGTNAAVVLAQQGSQIAQYFGPTGMVVGGVIAIGASLYTMGQRGKEAFNAMLGEAGSLHLAMKKLGAAEMPQLTEWADKSRASLAKLGAEMENTHTFLGGITALLGGDTVFDRRKALQSAQKTAGQDAIRINKEALAQSEKEVALAATKSKGREADTIAMEAQQKLAKKIAEIEKSAFYPATKKKLIKDAESVSKSETSNKLDKLEEDNAKKLESARSKVGNLQKEIGTMRIEILPDEQKMGILQGRLSAIFDESSKAFFDHSMSGLETWANSAAKAGNTDEQSKALGLMKDALSVQKEMKNAHDAIAKKTKEEASEASEALAKVRKRGVELRKEEAAKTTAKSEMLTSLAILQAEADGHGKVAEALRRQQGIRERALEIEKQLGVTKATALGVAEQEADLKDKASKIKKHEEKPGHIMGFSAHRGDKVHAMSKLGEAKFEGLERYNRLQAGGRGNRQLAAFGDGLSLDALTSPKRLAMAKAREKAGGGMKGVDANTQKEMVAILERIAASVAPLGAL